MSKVPAVEWTDHAVERAHERFGDCFDVVFPDGMLQWIGLRKNEGEKFRFRSGKMIFVCAKQGEAVVILTVMRYEGLDGVHESSWDNGGVGAYKGRVSHRRRVVSKRIRSTARDKRVLLED